MSESREYYSRSEEYGDVYISEEVLEMIAGAAALDVDGVTGLSGGTMSEQILAAKSCPRESPFSGSLIILPSMSPSRSAMAVSSRRSPKRSKRPSSPVWRIPAA